MDRLVMGGLLTAVAVVPAIARADQGEWRIGAAGGAMVVDARVGGANGTGIGFEACGRLGYGLSNTFELGLVGGYAHAADVEVDGATVDGQTGKLFANVSTVSLAVELRWAPGVGLARAFERTAPYLAGRGGGALVVGTSQQLFMESSLLLASPTDDVHLRAFIGGALGIEHRLGDHFFLAVELAAATTGEARTFDVTAEVSWAWY